MKTSKPLNSAARLLSLTIAILLPVGSLSAENYIWNNPAGGDFGTSTNWTPNAIPGAADTVAWSASTPVLSGAVTSSQNRTVSILRTYQNTLTFDFGGNILSMGTPTIGTNGASTQTTFTNGDYRITGVGYIGGTSTLKVTGSNAKLTTATRLDIGYYAGTSTTPYLTELLVENGANYTAQSNNLYIGGRLDYSGGILRVTGSGSTATLDSSLRVYVGSGVAQTQNSGTFRIDGGAQSTGADTVYVGQGAGTIGTLLIEGTGSSMESKHVYVGGSASASGGTGNLLVHSGASLSLTGTINNWKNGAIYVGSGSTITANLINHGSATAGDETAVLKGSGTVVATSTSISGNIFIHGEVRAGDTDSGTGIGTLTFGSLDNAADVRFQGSSTTFLEFNNATDFDQIAILGSLTGASNDLGKLVLSFNFIPETTDTFTILTASSFSGSPAFSEIEWNGWATDGDISYAGNSITLLNVVPEPSSFLLLGLATLLGLGIFRRRAKTSCF